MAHFSYNRRLYCNDMQCDWQAIKATRNLWFIGLTVYCTPSWCPGETSNFVFPRTRTFFKPGKMAALCALIKNKKSTSQCQWWHCRLLRFPSLQFSVYIGWLQRVRCDNWPSFLADCSSTGWTKKYPNTKIMISQKRANIFVFNFAHLFRRHHAKVFCFLLNLLEIRQIDGNANCKNEFCNCTDCTKAWFYY